LVVLFLPQLAAASEDIVQTGDITIAADEKVMGDVVSLQGDVDIYGVVYGDVVALLGEVTIHSGGAVHGDVVSLTGAVDLRQGGSISGDQVSLGGIGRIISRPSGIRLPRFNLGRTVFNIMVRVVMAVFMGLLFPAVLTRVSTQAEKGLGPSAGTGALVWLAVIPLAIIVALTIIGIPLSLLVLLALWGAYQLGFAAISRLAGDRVFPKMDNALGALALGALMLSILVAIPILGLLTRIAIAIVGVGAVILTRFGSRDAV